MKTKKIKKSAKCRGSKNGTCSSITTNKGSKPASTKPTGYYNGL